MSNPSLIRQVSVLSPNTTPVSVTPEHTALGKWYFSLLPLPSSPAWPSWCLLSSHDEDSSPSVPGAHWKATNRLQSSMRKQRSSPGMLSSALGVLCSLYPWPLWTSGPALGPSHQFSCLTPLIKARSVAVFIQAILKHVKRDSDCSRWQEIGR